MPSPAKAVAFVLSAGLLLAVAACGTPNPIVARDPIPPPPPGYALSCYSSPSLLNSYPTACRRVDPTVVVEQRRAVVKALY